MTTSRLTSRLAWIVLAVCASDSLGAEIATVVAQAEQARIAAIEKASRSAVAVFSPDGNGGGSAVVISADGYAVTNFHVASPVGNFMKCGMDDGRLYDAVLVGIDPTGDVALIKLLGRDDFVPAEIVDSNEVRVGDWCFAVGNPFLLATDFHPTVTYGIVSGIHRYQYPAGSILEYTDCIQTDAAINPGNSGGPLFNAKGQLIGVNGRGSFEKRGRVNVGLGYAISINQIVNFLGSLRSGRIVDHATLGATFDSDESGRVIVSNILNSSDAYRRGLRYGDELKSFAGREIDSVNGFKNVLGIYPRDWRVPITVLRDGKLRTFNVRLAGVHSPQELLSKVKQPAEHPDPRPGPKPPEPEQEKSSAKDAEPAAEVAKYFIERPGFANYYFNQQNQQRVWTAFQGQADLSALTGNWQLAGKTADEREVNLTITDDGVSGTFGRRDYVITGDLDLSEQLDPSGSGGLLVALQLWRRLLVQGPDRFGDVVYLGTAPLLGNADLCDVLVATYDVVETRFWFDPNSGMLLALEMFSGSSEDPCEVYFHDYERRDEINVPTRIEVRWGDTVFAMIDLKTIDFGKGAQTET